MNFKKIIPLLAVAASLTALGSAGSAAAEAQPLELDPCVSQPANETLWLGANIPQVAAWSVGQYWLNSCPMFIVDVQVPVNSSGGPGFTRSFSLAAENAYSSTFEWAWHYRHCTEWKEITRVYRKNTAQTGYTYLGETGFRGVHDPARESCRLIPLEDSYDPWPSVLHPPAAGVTTYRVLTAGWFQRDSWREYPSRLVRAKHFRTL